MNSEIVIKLMTALSAIIVVAVTYWFTKKREREAEWRKEKLAHYKNYILALADSVGPNATPESKKAYTVAFNTVGLFASQKVIEKLHDYQKITKLTSDKIDLDKHDQVLTSLILEIRKDLKLQPEDNSSTFSYKMIAPFQ